MTNDLETEVLVIGAGPAGCAAAIRLARLGVSVLVADRQDVPRDKVCGDALMPDSLRAVADLGLEEHLRKIARPLHSLRIQAPNGLDVSLDGEFACQPRRAFDAMLQQASLEAGAELLTPYRLAEPIFEGSRVVGARFSEVGTDRRVSVSAELTLLATGAAAGPLEAFHVCRRRAPSAMAARSYYRMPPSLAAECDSLYLSYHESICPGYGWIFPGPDNVANLGVGMFYDARSQPFSTNIRDIWSVFIETFPPAKSIVRFGTQLSPLKGAPLRTRMTGSRLHRPGLLVLGDAAGMTFSASGEGVGKAMESGIVAARLAASYLAGLSGAPDDLGREYADSLANQYRALFNAYATVQAWLSYPRICNLLAMRARASQYARSQFEGMLEERVDPRSIFSPLGFLKIMTRKRR